MPYIHNSHSIQNNEFNDTYLSIETCCFLWSIVIEQAILDATNKSRKPRARKYRIDAMNWLSKHSLDLEIVCSYAGLDMKKLMNQEFLQLMHHRSRKILPRKFFKGLMERSR